MNTNVVFDKAMIQRYDHAGPRYTSYPTAVAFTDAFTEADYRLACQNSNDEPIPSPLSLYYHIPFCDTVCFYCGCNKIVTKHRDRAVDYLELLFQEIEMQGALFDRDRPVLQLHFGGGTPTFLSERQLESVMQKTAEHFTLAADDERDFSIEIDPRSVDANYIKTLGDLGFNRYSLGTQDLDAAVQKAVNRIQPMALTEQSIQACREAGAHSINIDLIYGLPLQTEASFAQTIDKIIELGPDRLSVFNYAHLPELFKPQRRINVSELPSPDTKLEILKNTISALTEAGYVYVGMDHFAKPEDELVVAQQTGELHRNFQGYSTHGNCDLVAMGVSSISQVCGRYSQNVKDIDSYRSHIEAGQLPVFRGAASTPEDNLRRFVIQQLSCYGKVIKRDIEQRFDIDFDTYFAYELDAYKAMAEDELVSLNDQQIEVQPIGRLLLRNVCMVFDAYLRQADQVKPRFSRAI